jgi:hypothetical protein
MAIMAALRLAAHSFLENMVLAPVVVRESWQLK